MKELDLTEGHATGIPTIQDELKMNGSDNAVIETDEDRSYFLIEIPCRKGFKEEIKINHKASDRNLVILELCRMPQSRKDILDYIGVTNQTKNFRSIIEPLISKGLLQRTVPDIPQNRNQQYVLTDKGLKAIEEANKKVTKFFRQWLGRIFDRKFSPTIAFHSICHTRVILY